jgi:hypothetical protein
MARDLGRRTDGGVARSPWDGQEASMSRDKDPGGRPKDDPRMGGAREDHNKPEQSEPPGKRLKGQPGDTERSREEGTPAERRSGVNVDPGARGR